MLFFKSKTLSHRQTAMIGLVLAIISLLVTAFTVFVFPLFGAWLNVNGIYDLDLFLLVFFFTIFCSLQGLLLFGFPLFYAQDKKSHMTGFQIMIYTLAWMLILVLLMGAFLVPLKSQDTYTLEDLESFEETLEVPVQ